MTVSTTLLPPEALESHIAILGKTGSGKSNLAKVIAEKLMFAGERVCGVDPTGTWWGLRLEAGGKKPSRFKPVIFGGDHGDIPISEQHGAVLAEAIGTSADSAIIDTQQMTVGQRTRFFAAFAETLLRANRGPLHLIIDEAHLFAPQGKVNDPQSGAMLGAANNLVSLGRGRGLRIILISQRPAKLHKDSLTQAETLIAMRLIAPQDRNAVKDWIGEWADPERGKEIINSLPSLARGDAWVWSPQIGYLERRSFPLAATFDSGTAEANAAAHALPSIDLARIGDKMDTIRQEAQANDPKRLKARIAELEREKAKPAAAVVDEAAIGNAWTEGYTKGVDEGFKSGMDAGVAAERQRLGQKVLDFAGQFALATAEPITHDVTPPKSTPAPKLQTAAKPAPIVAQSPAAKIPIDADRAVTGPQMKALGALAWWKAMGNDAPLRQQIAAICGWAGTKGHLKNVIGGLSSAGLVTYPAQGRVQLTPEGAAIAPEPDMSASVVDGIRSVLTGPQKAVFEVLLPSKNVPMEREAIAASLGWDGTKGHLKNVVGSLSSLEVVTYPSKGSVALSDWIFA